MSSLVVVVIVAAVALVVGMASFWLGRRATAPTSADPKRLEEHDFYPFIVNESGHIEFSSQRFRDSVDHFLTHRNPVAARELIVIGEQNFVRDTFGTAHLNRYKELYKAYHGDSVIDDNEAFLENYKRIVRLIGRSFPHTGIEILLHNLVNPSKSIVTIEGGEVTGRTLEMGTTKLVLDLKTRRHRNQDKLNYELNIGARQFKCTTIPIFRSEYGLVGAICINIDARFLREDVMPNKEKQEAFFDNFLRADMVLDQNILSKDEYQAALRGKRHFLDEAIRATPISPKDSLLAAIMFSDIAGYTSLMQRDEIAALQVLESSGRIHRTQVARFGGRLLKEMGDGILASFSSVSRAVDCARAIQQAVRATGTFEVRIGIHLGEVTQAGGDVFGDGVNIASRIHGEAEPGGIAVSQVVYDNVKNREGLTSRDIGERHLKHIAEPIRVHLISP